MVRFWFQVLSMKANERAAQRHKNGEWLPPRPLGSNVLVNDHSRTFWYQYHNGETASAQAPSADATTHVKTYSFYVNNDRFWMYPCNATDYRVGDGEIEAPLSDDSDLEATGNGSSDDDSLEDNNLLEDWRPLTFTWDFHGANTATSCATFRAEKEFLQVMRRNQAWALQVLPDRYHTESELAANDSGKGGLVGKIPIIIALIAFSVATHLVPDALKHCLRRNYVLHHEPRGLGCKLNLMIDRMSLTSTGTSRRGLVVRVFRPKDAEAQQVCSQAQHGQTNPSYHELKSFEYGRSEFGSFFP